jgi:hypothetical protein
MHWRVALAVVWPPALVVAIYVAVGRLGFYPSDEGLMQAYTYRILHGQVPHRDFISPRPLGSALLHVVDFLIPGPLFEVSRVVSLCEYVAYAALFAWLIFDLAPWRWGVAMAAGVATSVLINLNIFPLMSWYTVDGLLLIAAGMVIVRSGVKRDSWPVILAGFAVVGLAALTKQSFVPAPAFAWLLLAPRLVHASWRVRIEELFWTGLAAAVPSLLFVGVISALGGLHQMRAQLLGAQFIYGRPLISVWSPRHGDLLALTPLVGGAALLMAGIVLLEGRHRPRTRLALQLALTALLFAVPVVAQFGTAGSEWGDRVLWMAIAVWSVHCILTKSFDETGAALLGAAWMSSLSYGFPYPNFVVGTLVLYCLHRAWAGWTPSAVGLRLPAPALEPVALAVVAALLVVFLGARSQLVYDDRPASQLTASLDGVSPAFGSIRTNPETAQYLKQMADCIKQYPARYVAVLPENAGMYPALSLDNPFPIDWMWPGDMNGSEVRIVSTADRLNATGDYLVLFQTMTSVDLVRGKPISTPGPDVGIAAYTPLPSEIYARLNGQHLTCGSFLVVYSPPGG